MWLQTCVVLMCISQTFAEHPLNDYKKSNNKEIIVTSINVMTRLSKKVPQIASPELCAQKCNKESFFKCRAFHFNKWSKECSMLGFTSLTEGTIVEISDQLHLYEKKDYVRECVIGNGITYRGQAKMTKSGRSCQRWDATHPHDPRYRPQLYPDKELEENFCRNADEDDGGPWCYTTDPELRFESCNIKQCSDDPCLVCIGQSYRGFVEYTESGRRCQRWDAQNPHKHQFNPSNYPKFSLDDNYCRNPNGRSRPWCFTTDKDVEWEYCNIKKCEVQPQVRPSRASGRHCLEGKGENYRGLVNKTATDIVCQRWDSQTPQSHKYLPSDYKCKDLSDNYCRNPDGAEAPWCLTVKPEVHKSYCFQIARCPEGNANDKEACYDGIGEDYRGRVSTTRLGIQCQRWDSKSPHKPIIDVKNYPKAGLERNFCRNPDNDRHGPWCYTTDLEQEWDYCGLKPCAGSPIPGPTLGEGTADCNICGTKGQKFGRIIGGEAGDSPWTVSLRDGKEKHFCGAVLIDRLWLLSSRQCFPSCNLDASQYQAWIGIKKEDQVPDNLSSQSIAISKLVCGPANAKIVMLKLERAAFIDKDVKLICMPVQGAIVPAGTSCEISGFGETHRLEQNGALNIASIQVVAGDTCGVHHKRQIEDTEICAGNTEGKIDSCERDYGGPLACKEESCYVLQGIITPGRSCAKLKRPGVFVRVAAYTDWINKVIGQRNPV
ncbi:unnamed protein product [Lampetra fluviatilis]